MSEDVQRTHKIKFVYGFMDLDGNHWPDWTDDWTFDEISEIRRGVSTATFRKLSEKLRRTP